MAKMTRADKRRRRIAKIVEMQLDGMVKTDSWLHKSFEDLYYLHNAWKERKLTPDYYGASLADMVLNDKAQQIQRSMDRAILEELNGIPTYIQMDRANLCNTTQGQRLQGVQDRHTLDQG